MCYIHFSRGSIGVPKKRQTKITIEINQKKYTIIGDESESHVRLVAELVNEKMEEIHQKNRHLDSTNIAVLTAINTMNDYVKLKEDYDDLIKLIEEDS